MPGRRVLTAALVSLVAGCGGASPGEAAARSACAAYANTGRHQVATTVEQADAIRETARSNAGRAADADPRWEALQRDIEDFFAHQGTLAQQAAVDDVDAYFAADRRVQADCADAGEDIGPLHP